MKEYRLRKFVIEENLSEPRMIFSRFYRTEELAKLAAQEECGANLVWTNKSKGIVESCINNKIYDVKTFEFEGV